ncbi:LOW QUALITY PROTEIN: uncharacterized protein LOC120638137 [Ornithorhynchus anatinus]|uniref:LOW QUALITY PROTEIN: uncharacterized protein LOC120638137 n=1 Tax=Ornithorhynchus anatinus TaxID=9258 RepID=UPI0019D4843D|nr:LOW QUALITY PROTEIN: uncharacterized protein LOC120638137 [Ornithorhynchus anatinus]
MDVTHWGRDCVHVSVDTHSGFLMATKQPGEAVRHVQSHLYHWFASSGVPREIKTDNGPAYTSQTMAKFFTTFGIKHVTCIAYNPNGQAIVEHANRMLRTLLTKQGVGWRVGQRELDTAVYTHSFLGVDRVSGLTPAMRHLCVADKSGLPSRWTQMDDVAQQAMWKDAQVLGDNVTTLITWDNPIRNHSYSEAAAPVLFASLAGTQHPGLWKAFTTLRTMNVTVHSCPCKGPCQDYPYRVWRAVFREGLNITLESTPENCTDYRYHFTGRILIPSPYAFLHCRLGSNRSVEGHGQGIVTFLVWRPGYLLVPVRSAHPWFSSLSERNWYHVSQWIKQQRRELFEAVLGIASLAFSAFQEWQIQNLFDGIGYLGSQLQAFMHSTCQAFAVQQQLDVSLQQEATGSPLSVTWKACSWRRTFLPSYRSCGFWSTNCALRS